MHNVPGFSRTWAVYCDGSVFVCSPRSAGLGWAGLGASNRRVLISHQLIIFHTASGQAGGRSR